MLGIKLYFTLSREATASQKRIKGGMKMLLDIGQIQQMIREGSFACGEGIKGRIMSEKLTEEDIITLSKLFRGLQYSASTAHLMFTDATQTDFKPFIRVDYEEFKPETYWGVAVSVNGKDEIFFSNDFKSDLFNAMTKYPDHYITSSVQQYIDDAGIKL